MADNKEKTIKLPTANIDKVIDHRGIYGTESLCRLRIFLYSLADVVLLTEPTDNTVDPLQAALGKSPAL